MNALLRMWTQLFGAKVLLRVRTHLLVAEMPSWLLGLSCLKLLNTTQPVERQKTKVFWCLLNASFMCCVLVMVSLLPYGVDTQILV